MCSDVLSESETDAAERNALPSRMFYTTMNISTTLAGLLENIEVRNKTPSPQERERGGGKEGWSEKEIFLHFHLKLIFFWSILSCFLFIR